MNVIITLLMATFVVVPEVNGIKQKLLKKEVHFLCKLNFFNLQVISDMSADLARQNRTNSRKRLPIDQVDRANELQVVWAFNVSITTSTSFNIRFVSVF